MSPRVPLVVLAGLLALAACGGSDDPPFSIASGSGAPSGSPSSSTPAVVDVSLPPLPSLTAAPSRTPSTAPSATTTRPATAPAGTARPTTAQPATAQPATAPPATAPPTTARPTTARPTTARPTTAAPAPATARVSMGDNVFAPRSVTVARGGQVTTSNDGRRDHDWVGPFWDSDNMVPGASFTVTFPDAGTFDYVCTYHGGMTGSIVVR